MASPALNWDRPNPFTWKISCCREHEDRLGHVNNVQYLHWLEEAGWQHISNLGAPWDAWKQACVGMATTETRVQYLAAANAGDLLSVGTWLLAGDRLRMKRQFQIIRLQDNATLLRAEMDFVCISLATGKPRRKPAFMEAAHQKGIAASALP